MGAGDCVRGPTLAERTANPGPRAGDCDFCGGRGGKGASGDRCGSDIDIAALGERRLAGMVGILSEDPLRRVSGGGSAVGGALRSPLGSRGESDIVMSTDTAPEKPD